MDKDEKGFTLMELLVSIVVLSAGLLGFVYLLILSLNLSQNAYGQTQLLFAVNDLVETIRMQNIPASEAVSGKDFLSTPDECDVTSVLPAHQVSCFYKKLAETLPFGTADISTHTDYYIIKVFWYDKGLASEQAPGEAGCERLVNRVWSESVRWPIGTEPDEAVCMVSRTWIV